MTSIIRLNQKRKELLLQFRATKDPAVKATISALSTKMDAEYRRAPGETAYGAAYSGFRNPEDEDNGPTP